MAYNFICYTKCGTCRKAKKWLEENNIEFIERPIKEENPKKEELIDWIFKSGLPIKKFFNTSGNIYKNLNLKDKLPDMSDDDKLNLLASDGMLVKRPIITDGETILVGFKEHEWEEKIK